MLWPIVQLPLEWPDTHYLAAAFGWLELGNPSEARAELAGIHAERQNHPDVLEVRWLVCAEQQLWGEGLQIARGLLEAAPDRPSGWLHQAYALRRVPSGGLQQAWDALLPAADKFPSEAIIPFNLSCYACQAQRLDDARAWLRRALTIGGKDHIKQLALADSDLAPLWDEIRGY